MKKDKEQQEFLVNFDDSDYQIDMRVDPLTTMDTIKTEYKELMQKHKQNVENKEKQNNRPVSEGEERAFAKQDEINKSNNKSSEDELYAPYKREPAKANNG